MSPTPLRHPALAVFSIAQADSCKTAGPGTCSARCRALPERAAVAPASASRAALKAGEAPPRWLNKPSRQEGLCCSLRLCWAAPGCSGGTRCCAAPARAPGTALLGSRTAIVRHECDLPGGWLGWPRRTRPAVRAASPARGRGGMGERCQRRAASPGWLRSPAAGVRPGPRTAQLLGLAVWEVLLHPDLYFIFFPVEVPFSPTLLQSEIGSLVD